MKKAKVMLTAVAVVAIAAGVLAAKAKRTSDSVFINDKGVCTSQVFDATTTSTDGGTEVSGVSVNTVADASNPCSLTTIYYTNLTQE